MAIPADTSLKVQLHTLELVYPPICNQVAEWLREADDPGVMETMSQANLYAVTQRKEVIFTDFAMSEDRLRYRFNVGFVDESHKSEVILDFRELADPGTDELEIELGPKLVRAWTLADDGSKQDVASWFTPDLLLYHRWRQGPGIVGLDDYEVFTRYLLHYVGISKRADAFIRLVKQPHEKRIRILSNERTFTAGSRLSEEICLFFFRVEPLHLHITADPREIDFGFKPDRTSAFSDAEKAIIHTLRPKYNTVTYQKYPKSTDGLSEEGLASYSFVIDESIQFYTDSGSLRGKWSGPELPVSDAADSIVVEANQVQIMTPADVIESLSKMRS